MVKNKKFRQVAYSSVCIFSLLAANAEGFTANDYFAAASNGNLEQMRSFIEESRTVMQQSGGGYSMNLDIKDAYGNTAVMNAAAQGHLNVLSYLVNYGANVQLQNNAGQTAYSLAMQNGHMDVAEFLLSEFQPQVDQEQEFGNNVYEYPPLTEPAAPVQAVPTVTSATSLGLNYPILMTALGAAAIGGTVAALSSGSGGSGGSSQGSLIQSGISDTGGSSGIGDTHPNADDPTTFAAAEQTAQEGYAAMRTRFAAARGYDGSIYVRNPSTGLLVNDTPDGNIKVAVLDTGVDLTHTDLDANISDPVTCTISGNGCHTGGQDTDGHGTSVAGIIAAEKNGIGMQGIAPKAKIIPIAFLNEEFNGNPDGSDISGIKYATDKNADIINASYGIKTLAGKEVPIITATTGDFGAAYTPAQLRSLMTANENSTNYLKVFNDYVNSHGVMVWAAGNASMDQVDVLSGLPYYFRGANPGGVTGYTTVNPELYDWSKNWITVVSLQDNNTTISTFSNECGVAKEWCLAAPGEIASSTALGGGHAVPGNGTSFAAPNVSGALAVLMGAFPHLTPEEAVEILFDTATDLGAPDVDEVYGHGLVNLEKATNPAQGGWNIITGPSSLSAGFSVQNSSLSLSSSFGDGLNSLASKKLVFLDKYRKDYAISLGSLVHMNSEKRDPLDTMQKLGASNLPEMGDNGGLQVGYTALTGSTTDGLESRKYAGEKRLDKLMLSTNLPILSHVVKASFADGVNMSDVEKIGNKTSLAENTISGSFKNQYLGLSEDAKNVSIATGDEKLGTKVGYYTSNGKTDEFASIDNASVKGIYGAVNYQPAEGSTLYLQSGMNAESGSFLGSKSGGALAFGEESKTYFTGLSFEHSLADDITFLGNYTLGVTELGLSQNSLIKNASNAYSDSFALGLEFSNVLENDKFGIAFSQPMRIRSANVDVSLPVGVAANGSMIYENTSASIAPEGRELDLEGYYARALGVDSKLMFGSILRMQPDNVKDADAEGLFMTKYNLQF